MTTAKFRLATFAATTLVTLPAAAQDTIYWAQTGPGGFMTNGPAYVMKANADGSGITQLVSSTSKIKGPNGLEFGAGDLYWPDQVLGGVYRAETDGTLPNMVPNSSDNVYDVSVANGKVYWVNGAGNKLKSANLDGSAPADLLTGLAFPVAVQATSQYLYWTDFNTKKIRRADLDGSGTIDLISTGLDWYPYDFEVTDSHIYYFGKNASNTGGIWRADLNGANRIEILADGYLKKGIDVTADAIYWTSYDYNSGYGLPVVARMALDGTGRQNVIVGASGIAFHGVVAQSAAPVPEPETYALMLVGLGLVGLAVRRKVKPVYRLG